MQGRASLQAYTPIHVFNTANMLDALAIIAFTAFDVSSCFSIITGIFVETLSFFLGLL